MNAICELLVGQRVVMPVEAAIVVEAGRFMAILPGGEKHKAQMSQVIRGGDTAIEFSDGILGFVMGSKVLFGSLME